MHYEDSDIRISAQNMSIFSILQKRHKNLSFLYVYNSETPIQT